MNSQAAVSGESLRDCCVAALEAIKARDIETIDVRGRTSIADWMLICTGTSERHLSAMAAKVIEALKQAGAPPQGVEGENGSQWVLVDAGDVVVHLMLAEAREFYQLERLWQDVERLRDGSP